MAGARVDERRRTHRATQLERMKQEIGEDSFKGLEALADCKHDVALAYGRTVAQSDNKDHALAAL